MRRGAGCNKGADIVFSLAALGLNLVITVLHVVGLVKSDEGSSVWELLFREGVIYYLTAFAFNAVPAVGSPPSHVLCCLPDIAIRLGHEPLES